MGTICIAPALCLCVSVAGWPHVPLSGDGDGDHLNVRLPHLPHLPDQAVGLTPCKLPHGSTAATFMPGNKQEARCVGSCPVIFEAVLFCGNFSCKVDRLLFRLILNKLGLNSKCPRLDSQGLENHYRNSYLDAIYMQFRSSLS